MLGILLCQTTVAAMQAQATTRTEVVLLRASDQFDTGRARPAVTRIIANRRAGEDIDATPLLVVLVAKEIILIGNDTQDR